MFAFSQAISRFFKTKKKSQDVVTRGIVAGRVEEGEGLVWIASVQEDMAQIFLQDTPTVTVEPSDQETNIEPSEASPIARPRSTLRRKVVKDTDSKTDSFGGSPLPLTVPTTLQKCTSFLDEHGLDTKGIYRISGRQGTVNMLLGLFHDHAEEITLLPPNSDSHYEKRPLSADSVSFKNMFSNPTLLYDNDVNVIAGVVKAWCRAGLPHHDTIQPLIPYEYYQRFMDVASIQDYRARMIELQDVLHTLPPLQFSSLKHLAIHLGRVAQKSSINGMTAKNLALVFAPTLLHHERQAVLDMENQGLIMIIIETMIDYGEWLFGPIEYEGEEEDVKANSLEPEPIEPASLDRRSSSRLSLKFRERPPETDSLLRRKQGNRNYVWLDEDHRRSVTSISDSSSHRSSVRISVA